MPQVIFEKKDRIAYLTINRPEKMNALNAEVVNGLNTAWHDIENDTDVWCTIVTGTGGRAFSAGADLKEMSDRRKGVGEGLLASIRAAGFWRTSDLTKPVIAAVDGYCLAGGLELALACDFIIASDRSHFGLSEVLRAIIPGGGGTQRLPRAIPFRRALEVLLTGDRLNAQQAYDLGLVNRGGEARRRDVHRRGAGKQDQRERPTGGAGDKAAGVPGHGHAFGAGASARGAGFAADPQDGGL